MKSSIDVEFEFHFVGGERGKVQYYCMKDDL